MASVPGMFNSSGSPLPGLEKSPSPQKVPPQTTQPSQTQTNPGANQPNPGANQSQPSGNNINTGFSLKPSLKLNMGKNHSSGNRGFIGNPMPNFSNSGPFSPGLFSSKRVWVKRPNGTATTITVNQSDIIDDLKLGIMNKFPNALAKFFDPADITIKMDLQSRKLATASSNNQAPPHKKVNVWSSTSPDSSKPLSSPISSSFDKSQPQSQQPPLQLQVSPSQPLNFQPLAQLQPPNPTYSYINLEPDQNVWNLLDLYFPGGMNMNEALIIETPAIEDHSLQYGYPSIDVSRKSVGNLPPNFYSTTDPNITNIYRRSSSPVHNTLNPQQQMYNQNRASTPVASSYNQGYYQPKPQYLNEPANQIYKERSLSPNNNNNNNNNNGNNNNNNAINRTLPLPNGISFHRRSQSNPPQSPVSNTNLQQHQNPNQKQNNPNNNQAVLLLPKNFSLSSNSNAHSSDKKRLSLDESFVQKNRDHVTSPVNKNLSNIKSPDELSEAQVPFPSIESKTASSSLPKLDVNLTKESPAPSPLDQNQHQGQESPADSIPVAQFDSKHNAKLGLDKPDASHSNGNQDQRDKSQTTRANGKNDSSLPHNDMGSETRLAATEKPNLVHRQSSGSKKSNNGSNKTATEAVLPSISVLVVEDNAINQAILGAFLRKHKIHYEIAKNGEEAIAKWRKGGFHLVLMDIQLPVKSGIEATKEIRHLERINRIGVFAENEVNGPKNLEDLSDSERLDLNVFRSPVIIVALTASSNSSIDRSNALRAGCNDYLTKPVNLVWLQNKITEWGCMQALIDFDGWKTKRSNFNEQSAKKLTQKTRSRSGSQTKVLLGGNSRHQIQTQ